MEQLLVAHDHVAQREVTWVSDRSFRPLPGANRLKFTPDGRHVLITAGSALVVMDASTRKEVKRLATVHGSGGIQMEPDGDRAYVACGPDGNVTVIDLKTLEAVGHIDVSGPDGLAWAAMQ